MAKRAIFEQDMWSISEEELQNLVNREAGEIHLHGAHYWLNLNFHVMKKAQTARHDAYVEAILPKREPQEEDEDLDGILSLPNWEGIENGVYVNVVKQREAKKKTYTVLFNTKHPNGKVLKTALFVPPDTQPSVDFMKRDPISFEDIFNSLTRKYREILFYDDTVMHEVLALAAMSTYFREAFRTYPYMDFQGAEVNSGKTTSMECLIFASFYGFATMDPTGPVLFRAIDNCHATTGIDEIDNLIVDPEKNSAIQGILNASNKKGAVAYRTNKDTYQPEPYDAFGMKAFSRIKPIPDGLISRSITFLCVRAPVKMRQLAGASEFVTERDALYQKRLTDSETVMESMRKAWENIDMRNRDREKWISILTMALTISNGLFEKIRQWATDHAKVMVEAQVDDVKKTLVEALIGRSGNVSVYDISEDFMFLLEKYDLIKKDYQGQPQKWQTRTVLRLLGELGVFKSSTQPREPATGRTQVWVNSARIDALARGTYGILENVRQEELKTENGGSVPTPSQSSQSSQSSHWREEIEQRYE